MFQVVLFGLLLLATVACALAGVTYITYKIVFYILYWYYRIALFFGLQTLHLALHHGLDRSTLIEGDAMKPIQDEWMALHDWASSYRMQQSITVWEFVQMLGLPPSSEYMYPLYPSQRQGLPSLKRGSVGAELRSALVEGKKNGQLVGKVAGPPSLAVRAQDHFYMHESELLARAGIFDCFFEASDPVVVRVVMDDGTEEERARPVLEDLYSGWEGLKFEFLRSTNLHENPSNIRVGNGTGTAFAVTTKFGISAGHVLGVEDATVYWHPSQREWESGKFLETDAYTNIGHTDSRFVMREKNLDVGFFRLNEKLLAKPGMDSFCGYEVRWSDKCLVKDNLNVKKHGSVTGVTFGRVYEKKFCSLKTFVVQSVVIGPFALKADSGSLVLDEQHNVLGIVVKDLDIGASFGEQVVCTKASAFSPYLADLGVI